MTTIPWKKPHLNGIWSYSLKTPIDAIESHKRSRKSKKPYALGQPNTKMVKNQCSKPLTWKTCSWGVLSVVSTLVDEAYRQKMSHAPLSQCVGNSLKSEIYVCGSHVHFLAIRLGGQAHRHPIVLLRGLCHPTILTLSVFQRNTPRLYPWLPGNSSLFGSNPSPKLIPYRKQIENIG